MIKISKHDILKFNIIHDKYFQISTKRDAMFKAIQKIGEMEGWEIEDPRWDMLHNTISTIYSKKNDLTYESEVYSYTIYNDFCKFLQKKYNITEMEFPDIMNEQEYISPLYKIGDGGKLLWEEYVKVYELIQNAL